MCDFEELMELIRSFACNQYPQCEDCEMVLNGHECRSAIERQAADAIEKLLDENKAIKQSNKDAAMRNKLLCDEISHMKEKVPKWISVEERLPAVGERVLACVGIPGDLIVYDGVRWNGEEWEAEAEAAYDYWTAIDDPVAYWMPLPEPPKEDTDNA